MRSDIPWLMTSATVVLIAGISLIKPTPRLVWNASASAPIGLYWIVPTEAPSGPDRTASAIKSHVEEASRRFLIPSSWIWAVIRVESAGDVRALSNKGAVGLMQLMPKTWASLRQQHGLGVDSYDPRDNILAGAAYLRELHDRYGEVGFLAAYNAGPGRYEDHLSGRRTLPAETVD